ncbi:F0F1 ATP synthase subunit A [Enemella evansiae]|uniref:F0F1 ATP synthase subunit A n=1 Tax=Enemella evansiae TaxID=2016499 RepID=UPI000B96B4DB|nr:F0F1 ATP synthase subunit A [Enemella evansiae]OYN98960.1 ATP synthase F0 subunit A [Enemella evansiae]OYO01274.1 ATP synthase F0 subunit A [Enemella evansiae]OYO05014.1 ATP synthase F0 subunit A [Enemella evansiae]PFG67526.1 F-type H+-transporting ATPase subunit a [Propionibacteriaceae bacterium ES.041]
MNPSTPLLPLEGGGGYKPPSLEDFRFNGLPGWWDSAPAWLNKPFVMAVIAAVLVIVVWLLASRKLTVLPSKRQFFWEYIYDFIRNGVARDALGHDFRRYLPYLLGLFSFIWVNNVFGVFPLFMFPTFSNVGYAWGLAILSWIIYNAAGIARHGGKYFKNSLFPAGVPAPLYILITPIELLSNFIVRPVTLGLRLFGNMFAGHLVVLVFVVGGTYLLTESQGLFYKFAGGVSLVFSFAIFALELLVATLQAYIFTVLTAQYVASSLAEDH